MGIVYSLPNRSERLIAAGRLCLVTFAIFALWLDHNEPVKYINAVYFLLAGCLCYSIVLVWAAWWTYLARSDSALIIHVLDLLMFFGFMFLISDPANPFFAFFVFFLVVSATLRWQWRGNLYTAALILGVEIVMASYPAILPGGASFEKDHLICFIIYLIVISALLGYLGFNEEKQRGRISGLASWPDSIPEELYPLANEILQRASSLLDAPRALLLWNEEQEHRLHVATWSDGQFQHNIESPDTFGSLVAEPMAGKNFLCRNSLVRKQLVLHNSPTGFKQWHGMPLNPELQRRFSIKSVLSLVLEGECITGRLFALDKNYMTSDDLVLGRIVSNEASFSLDQFYLQKRLRETAAVEERIRLARDLHDGLLQSMTGTVMQLEAAQQMIEKNPQTARERLLDIRQQISSDQQKLRSHIRDLKSPCSCFPEWDGNLPGRLTELAGNLERQWGLNIGIDINLHLIRIPWTMAQGIYFIIHEAIINAARHAGASSIQAEITSTDHQLRIIVADNGSGFPFVGRYNQEDLNSMKLGPIVMMERVTSLGGLLTIESGDSGARLEITLTIPEKMN